MKFNILIFLLIFLLCVVNVDASTSYISNTLNYTNSTSNSETYQCIQEYTNITDGYCGMNTGSYSKTGTSSTWYNGIDGDYDTYTGAGIGYSLRIISVYTVPKNVIVSSTKWKVKTGGGTATKDIPLECISDNITVSMFSSTGMCGSNCGGLSCYNFTSSNWLDLGDAVSDSNELYEESILWNTTNIYKFENNQTLLRWFTLPKILNYTSAKFNISGFNYTSNHLNNLAIRSYNLTSPMGSPTSVCYSYLANDTNQDNWACMTNNSILAMNWTVPYNSKNYNFTYTFSAYNCSTGSYQMFTNFSCYYSGSYKQQYTFSSSGTCSELQAPDFTFVIPLNNSCYNSGNLALKMEVSKYTNASMEANIYTSWLNYQKDTLPSNLNVSFDITQLFYNSGNYSQINNITNNFYNLINSYISSCSAINGFCYLPLRSYSNSSGLVSITDINIYGEEYIKPNLTIYEPNTTYNLITYIPLNFSAVDNYMLDKCQYNVTRGASLEVSDTYVNCSLNTTFTVSGSASYILRMCVNDTSGNQNCTTSGFTTINYIAPPDSTSSGGGGGGLQEIIIDALNKTRLSGAVCDVKYPPVTSAWIQLTNNFTWKNIKTLWLAFWDYVPCKSAGSIVPF